jgi:hypothetical protein
MFATSMRKNGFILIGLAGAAVALAGSPGYLPKVGPVALSFRTSVSSTPSERAAVLPPLYVPPPVEAPNSESNSVPEPIGETATNALSPSPMDQTPGGIDLSASSPTNSNDQLIGSILDTNAIISPQVFLRYFTPSRPGAKPGVGTEAIIVPPTDFNPAHPAMPPSSSATYSQPDP